METVGVSELRENLMKYLKKVQAGEPVTITSRGHQVARLVPLEERMKESGRILRQLRKTAVLGDIVSPIEEEWEVMK